MLKRLSSWFHSSPSIPKKNPLYVYQPERVPISHEQAVNILLDKGLRLQKGWVDISSPDRSAAIVAAAEKANLPLRDVTLDVEAYRKFLLTADYAGRYPDYYSSGLSEKSMEHFICLTYLRPQSGEVLIDVASENSPLSEIFSRLTGCIGYSQDIMYPPGVEGLRIGGDACSMPVDAGFADMACLTCSLEHFEGNGDTLLFKELHRVLRPGGRAVVVPFYLSDASAVQTDPVVAVSAEVDFDPDATIYCAEGWGNRHGRFYSPLTFKQRIVDPCRNEFTFICHRVTNIADLPEGVHLRFFFVAIRQ